MFLFNRLLAETEIQLLERLSLVADCGPGSMQCSGRCVRNTQICDGVSQCRNGEDERNCCEYMY